MRALAFALAVLAAPSMAQAPGTDAFRLSIGFYRSDELGTTGFKIAVVAFDATLPSTSDGTPLELWTGTKRWQIDPSVGYQSSSGALTYTTGPAAFSVSWPGYQLQGQSAFLVDTTFMGPPVLEDTATLYYTVHGVHGSTPGVVNVTVRRTQAVAVASGVGTGHRSVTFRGPPMTAGIAMAATSVRAQPESILGGSVLLPFPGFVQLAFVSDAAGEATFLTPEVAGFKYHLQAGFMVQPFQVETTNLVTVPRARRWPGQTP